MSESNNNKIFEKIDVDFTKIRTGIKNFKSYDDQHQLSCKVKTFNNSKKNRLSLFQSKYGFSDPFFSAANSNDVSSLKNCLLKGYDVNFADNHGRSALHLAACKGNFEAAKILLTNGSNPNSKDKNGNTPLHLSALANHIRLITLLLRCGADLNEIDNNGRTPLHLAKSKLKILQDCTSYNSDELKEEAKHVIEMMQIYLTKSGKTEKLIVLNQFINRLNLHDKKEDVNEDLSVLSDILNALKVI